MELLRRKSLAVVALLLAIFVRFAEAATPNEYSVKSVFLYNFCRFIDWPDSAFAGPNDPLIIGIIGDDPFGSLLDEAIAGETFHGRSIVVEHYKSPREIGRCQILFVSASESARLNDILSVVGPKSVVTVGETETFIARGGMIALIADRGKVRLVINPDALRAARVDASSKLLRVAEIAR